MKIRYYTEAKFTPTFVDVLKGAKRYAFGDAEVEFEQVDQPGAGVLCFGTGLVGHLMPTSKVLTMSADGLSLLVRGLKISAGTIPLPASKQARVIESVAELDALGEHIVVDIETRGDIDGPRADLELLCVGIWDGSDMPVMLVPADLCASKELGEFLTSRKIICHNSAFDVAVLNALLGTRLRPNAETMGYMLLSSVYGPWGYIAPRYGKQNLTLWALILGPTTNTRKSASLHRFSQERRTSWKKRIQDVIDIGGDFTTEGLNTLLGERADKVTFAHRDEIDGFLEEMTQKSYMAGTKQAMTAMYDGRLSPKWRAADKKAAAEAKPEHKEVIFNFLGVGIPEALASKLNIKDIQSGFLPRFLFCIGDPQPWNPDAERVQQAEDPTMFSRSKQDPTVATFMNEFMLGRSKWGGNRENFIMLSDEAADRLTQWSIDAAKLTRELGMFDVLNPGRERMRYSMWRAAALLSMHKGEETVSELTMLHVIKQAEDWFSDLIRMTSMVSDSEFTSVADEIEEFIAMGDDDRRNMTEVYRKFGRKSVVDEYVDNLVAQGRVRKTIDRKTQDKFVQALV